MGLIRPHERIVGHAKPWSFSETIFSWMFHVEATWNLTELAGCEHSCISGIHEAERKQDGEPASIRLQPGTGMAQALPGVSLP